MDQEGVNFAAFFAEGGEAYALNGRQSKLSARDVAWDLFTWLSELPATQLPLSGQYRRSHLSDEGREDLRREGWYVFRFVSVVFRFALLCDLVDWQKEENTRVAPH